MSAWAWAPTPVQTAGPDGALRLRVVREEVFCCLQLCRRPGSAELDDDTRAARNCTLPFRPVTWTGGTPGTEPLHQIHMGLGTRWEREGRDVDFMRPREDIAGEGCPGGWYRSGWVRSLHKFRRRAGSDNQLLTRTADRLILEAIAYFEDEEAHALAAFHEAAEGLM